MRSLSALIACVVGILWVGSMLSTPRPLQSTLGQIERFDRRLDELIPPDAVIEVLAEGFEWAEGPVWIPSQEALLFSDIPRNVVLKWKEGDGISEFLKPSGYTGSAPPSKEPGSNGLLLDSAGRLILCQHGDRQIARLEKDGSQTVLVSEYQGKRLNSPNDATFKSNGDIYFTDPPYGLDGLNDNPAKELDFNGVYRLTPEGELTLLTREISFPNGIAFSPDEELLYVANSDPKKAIWMVFQVRGDGTLGPGRVFHDVTSWVGRYPGLPDGLKVDQKGNLFATSPGGVSIFSPEGELLGRIDTGVATANCGWGEDGSVLYITADNYLCRVRTTTSGW